MFIVALGRPLQKLFASPWQSLPTHIFPSPFPVPFSQPPASFLDAPQYLSPPVRYLLGNLSLLPNQSPACPGFSSHQIKNRQYPPLGLQSPEALPPWLQ